MPSTFPPKREAELVTHIGRNVFQAAFRSLQGRFGPIA